MPDLRTFLTTFLPSTCAACGEHIGFYDKHAIRDYLNGCWHTCLACGTRFRYAQPEVQEVNIEQTTIRNPVTHWVLSSGAAPNHYDAITTRPTLDEILDVAKTRHNLDPQQVKYLRETHYLWLTPEIHNAAFAAIYGCDCPWEGSHAVT